MDNYTSPEAIYKMMLATEDFEEDLEINIQRIKSVYDNCSLILGRDTVNYRHISGLEDVISSLWVAHSYAEDLHDQLKKQYLILANLSNL